MKYSTQKLLLSLFFLSGEPPVLATAAQLRFLTPELTEGGFRSLLHLLENKGVLMREQVTDSATFVLTDSGRRRLTEQFPALSWEYDEWRGEWSCLVFLQPPESDPQFRYLRKLLLKARAITISRGVYFLHPHSLSLVRTDLTALYEDSVVVVQVAAWQFGAERPIITKKTGMSDIVSTYSGISKEIDELLKKNNQKSATDHQYKVRVLQVLDRLLPILGEDPGYSSYFFPGYPRGRELVSRFQLLLQSIG